jgi:hypothetical protein
MNIINVFYGLGLLKIPFPPRYLLAMQCRPIRGRRGHVHERVRSKPAISAATSSRLVSAIHAEEGSYGSTFALDVPKGWRTDQFQPPRILRTLRLVFLRTLRLVFLRTLRLVFLRFILFLLTVRLVFLRTLRLVLRIPDLLGIFNIT